MGKAIVLRKYGNSDQLKLEDVEIKKPSEEELLLKQTAIAVHFHDIYVRTGLYKTLSLPGIQGLEAVGVVEEIGEGVSDFFPGDRVGYIDRNYGAYATHRVVNKKLCFKVPDFISDEIIATNFSRAITVQMLMEMVTQVRASDTILITAVTGGVGKIFAQWAKSLGVQVIGTVGSKEKLALGKSFGCDYTLTYDQPDFIDEIFDITNGNGVDKVFDSVGKDTFENSLKSVSICGHIINFGQSSGPIDPIQMSLLAAKSLTISRPIIFDYISERETYIKMVQSVFNAFKNGNIKTPTLTPYSLKDAYLAHGMLESRKGGGSVFLKT
jgi:NADPH2:quinone reductase